MVTLKMDNRRTLFLILLFTCLLSCVICKRSRAERRRERNREPIIERDDDDDKQEMEAESPTTVVPNDDVTDDITEEPEDGNSTGYYPSHTVNPGFRARITQKGFDFAAQFATDFLMVQMLRFKVPDVESDIATSHITVSNIHVEQFPEPKNKITILEKQGLRWQTWNMEPTFAADYMATMGFGFFSVEKSGNVTVKVSDMQFTLDFNIQPDPLNGRPFILATDCVANGEVEITFQGGLSDMLNAASSLLGSVIRNIIMDQICSQAKAEIDVNMQKELHTLPMVEAVGNFLELDFSFTQFPTFASDYLETSHKGMVRYTLDPHEPPFEPPVLPAFRKHRKRMMYVYVTDYLVNSGLYAAFLSGQMTFNVTEDIMDMVPVDALAILRLSCAGGAKNAGAAGICLGSVFPQLRRLHRPPHRVHAEVDMYAVEAPRIRFVRGTKAQMFTYSQAEFYVKEDGDGEGETRRKHLFTAQVNVTSAVKVVVNGSRVSFIIKDVRPSAVVTASSIGTVRRGQAFEKLLRLGAEKFIMQQLAEHAKKGFELPATEDVRFEKSVILPVKVKGLFVVATDIYINPNMDLQGMIEEQQAMMMATTPTQTEVPTNEE